MIENDKKNITTRNTAFNRSKTKNKRVTIPEGSNTLIKKNVDHAGLELTFQRSSSSITILCVTNCATEDCIEIPK